MNHITKAIAIAMATAQLSQIHFLHPNPIPTTRYVTSRRLRPINLSPPPTTNWAVRLSLVEQNSPVVKELVDFLYDDLPHLFDDKGIDPTAYDERVKFRDPITKHDTITGYLFNISLLKLLFKPLFFLHSAKQPVPSKPKPAMATTQVSIHFLRPIPTTYVTFRQRNLRPPTRTKGGSNWALRHSLEEKQSSPLVVKELVDFLYDDLPHLFDDQEIDPTVYDESLKYSDPITKLDTISGFLLNIALIKLLFNPLFSLHWVKQTGPYEITTRWTMVMTFMVLPWKPELVFTGTSIMGINPETGKFCSHLDLWDSIKNNDYFSVEGLLDVFKQLRIYKTPDLETPKYVILKRTANYEVRKYEPFIVVETVGDQLSGSTGFNDVAGYIFGKNSTAEKIPMTTPVFTQASDPQLSAVSVQIVLPSEKELSSLPVPNGEKIRLRKVEGCTAAVVKFSGKPTEDIVRKKEKELRSSLVKDGLKSEMGCLLARYNDPGRTWNFIMRNEVLVWLEDYSLEDS